MPEKFESNLKISKLQNQKYKTTPESEVSCINKKLSNMQHILKMEIKKLSSKLQR